MRIVLAIGIYESGGGASEWVANYATWLASRGHDVTIACARADAAPPGKCRLVTLSADKQTKNSWKRACRLQELVGRCEPDVVHDTGCLLAADIYHPLMGSLIHNWYRQLRAFPLRLAIKRVWHVRLWRDVRLQLHQCRSSRSIIACSDHTARDFRQFGYSDTIVVRNGIPPVKDYSAEECLQLRRNLKAEHRILMVASATNFYLKGVMSLLRAMSLLDGSVREKVFVVITGKETNRDFDRFIALHNLQTCCQRADWVEDIDLYYHASDVFLHPTYHDAGSLSTLKAIYAGCAVVTSRFDGSAELLQQGVNGLILEEPSDAKALAGIITRLVTDHTFRNSLRGAVHACRNQTLLEQSFSKLEELTLSLSKSTCAR